ncbi:MAG: DUF1156 domain-containing protein, partial [Candidatus Hodarchaeales archaeon]
ICIVCDTVIGAEEVKRKFQERETDQRIIAVVFRSKEASGKTYRVATKNDEEVYKQVLKSLEEKRERFSEWGIDPLPIEPISPHNSHAIFSVQRFGVKKWSDLFNLRQQLAIITFCNKIRVAYGELLKETQDNEYIRAVLSYLGLTLDRVASYNSKFGRWHVTGEKASDLFGIQNIGFVWDYLETNPISDNFSWKTNLRWVTRYLEQAANLPQASPIVQLGSATQLPFESNFFDAVFTDPPYYDNILYANLSDFFFVLLKRSIGFLFPELFETLLTPKSDEVVVNPTRHSSKKEAKNFFESSLRESFQEISRVLNSEGIAIIVYAHKTLEGWKAMINAIKESELVVTASWPLSTEMRGRMKAKSAVLSSSNYIAARKCEYEEKRSQSYSVLKSQLRPHLYKKLEMLWQEGVSGADFSNAAIGASLKVICMYKSIIGKFNENIEILTVLEDVKAISKDFIIDKVFSNTLDIVSPLTRFYIKFRDKYQNGKAPIDEVRVLAKKIGFDLKKELNKGLITKQDDFISVQGPLDRNFEIIGKSSDMIDVLHYMLLNWEMGGKTTVYGLFSSLDSFRQDIFYQVAQAISETLNDAKKEKKMLVGFLSGVQYLTQVQ